MAARQPATRRRYLLALLFEGTPLPLGILESSS